MTSRRLCIMITSASTATAFLDGYLGFLKDDGWEVTLVCSEGASVRRLVGSAGVMFEPIVMSREPALMRDVRSLVAAVRTIRRLRPDVLVYATPKASLLGALAGWITRTPRRIYEVWGLRLETETGPRRRLLWSLEWLTSRLSTAVIANSASLARRLETLGVNAGRNVLVLGHGSSHGVDGGHYSRATMMPDIDPSLRRDLDSSGLPVVGYVGRLHPDKGIDVLIDALVESERLGVPAQLLVVGDNEGVALDELAIRAGGSFPIHVTGFVADPRPMLAAMDMLVLPSRREGFPNVVLEAAGMEVPAIVSDATGCIDAVVDGVTGVVVRTGDAHDLARAIRQMIEDPDTRKNYAHAARERVLNEFVPRDVWGAHSRAWGAQ